MACDTQYAPAHTNQGSLFSPQTCNKSVPTHHSQCVHEWKKKSKPLADYFLPSEKNQINKIFFRLIKKKKAFEKKLTLKFFF